MTLGFIGLGLIGASLAMAYRAAHPDTRMIAYDTDAEVTDYALKQHLISEKADAINECFTPCDIVFLSAPASHNLFNLRIVLPFLREDAILTDVTSVKMPVHRLVDELHAGFRFVGGHPMTGKETGGIRHADKTLFQGARYILTTSPKTDGARVNRMKELIRDIGGIWQLMEPLAHDRAAAAVSHLPHVASAALVNLVRESDDPAQTMRSVAAGGFKDLTRISSSSPELWRQICLLNAEQLSAFLDAYMVRLKHFQRALDSADGETLAHFFQDARTYRENMT